MARAPDGRLATVKVLSSATVQGRPDSRSDARTLRDAERRGAPRDFFRGFTARLLDEAGRLLEERTVRASCGDELGVEGPWSRLGEAAVYELQSPEEAPLLAVRQVLGLRLDEPVGDIELRLGTTRGTNALLERRGGRTLFVTTRGFGDVLRIGYQDRPRLFDLAIEKPPPLFESVLEVDERTAADGSVLQSLDVAAAEAGLREARAAGIEAVSICLLHATKNPAHEEQLGVLAREIGFRWVALSSQTAASAVFVPRGDTTLVDAYLAPAIEDYVASIRRAAPDAHLSFLTSAGALSAPDAFTGKDSLLSGPAGGVVGAVRAAELERASHPSTRRVVALDMGGTSTDVSLHDGELALEFETEKAGVRIATPLLAIETVAAGGGSVCEFDGERLTVGPQSAAARPGPACYGAGGPLTVTDCNLWLGRLHPGAFPFPLDRGATAARLEDIAERLRRAGWRRSLEEIAAGFLDISVEHMAAAIRRISVSRGIDVRDDAIVAFGGAGAQHACAVAGKLGMRRVLVPELAGILSAEGVGRAELRKFTSSHIGVVLSAANLEEIERHLARLEAEASSALHSDGVSDACRLDVVRSLELRYAGQDSTLAVRTDRDHVDLVETQVGFEARHVDLFGFAHDDRAIEVVNLRVEVIAREPDAELAVRTSCATDSRSSVAEAEEITRVEFGFARVDAASLEVGDRLAGPVLVTAPFHTTVVEDGWSLDVSATGSQWIELDASECDSAKPELGEGAVPEETADPVLLEIFHQRFASIADEMGSVLRRTALSTNVRERLDFSCAVFDAAGRLIANAPHIPVHLGALGECIRRVIQSGENMESGDVLVTNDPGRGGSHLPDVTVLQAVFDRTGRTRQFWVANRAHHAEIGGRRPGSMPPDSRCLADEGVLIRRLRVLEGGAPDWESLEACLRDGPWPSRNPAENRADIEAQIAANQRGALLLRALVAECGDARVAAYTRFIREASGRLTERCLRARPQEERVFVDRMDDGAPLAVRIAIFDGRAHVSFAGSAGVRDDNLNATPAIVSSAVLYVFRCLLDEDIPLNDGVREQLTIDLPECFLAPRFDENPERSPAVAGGNVETSQRIVDALLGALGVAAASQGTMNNFLFGNARFGYYETIGGGSGATPSRDGADAVHTHMTNTRITDVEVLEQRYPVRVWQFGIRRGSGGRGAKRGGDGIVREVELLEEVDVSLVTQRRLVAPWGAAGGEPGARARNLRRRAEDSEWEELGPLASWTAAPGDRVRIETPGGGAWGASQGSA